MRVRLALSVMCLFLTAIVFAQDPVKVDPKHYTLVSENEQLRILKVHYGPHEKSVMHSHPNSVAVFLTDAQTHFTLSDGKSQDMSVKAGDARYTPAVTHLPEDTGEKPFELILVELKGKGSSSTKTSAAKPAGKKE